jgi:hypothetical protein
VTTLLPRTRDPVIDYREAFWFPAAPAQMWDAMERFDEFPMWWGWLRAFHADDHRLVEGNLLRGTVQPPLPYRFGVEVRLGRCERPHAVEAQIAGDVHGRAHLSLEPSGAGTCVTIDWSLAMVRGPIRAAALVAYPLVRWGHDRVVESTVNGFRRHAVPGPTGRVG